MLRLLCISVLLFVPLAVISAEERKNLSVEDVIAGFESEQLFYFEIILENGKYSRAFTKCLSSRPAASSWIRQHCQKNPELKNAFQCTGDNNLTHVWFVYDSERQCEEVRKPMKDKMDALLGQ